ncbi:hypothetical protein AHF37_10323 [Paragonimus kellicotti]|nr:hypothetical protein AHF37_10323 [Paragonimus kellicotti]
MFPFQIGCICNNAVLQDGKLHGQPTEGALLRLALQLRIADTRQLYSRVHEWSFSSETKMMMVSCLRNGQTQYAAPTYFAKGAVDRILQRCAYVQSLPIQTATSPHPLRFNESPNCLHQLPPYPMTADYRTAILTEAATLGSLGLRVLAFADGSDPDQLTFHGLVGLLDPPRPGVDLCVRTLHESGVRVVMITGDALETARAIGEFELCENSFSTKKHPIYLNKTVRSYHSNLFKWIALFNQLVITKTKQFNQ